MGNAILKELQLKKRLCHRNNAITERRPKVLLTTNKKREELDRRGGILLKAEGEQNGQEGTAGTGIIIYHREQQIL